MGCVNAVNIEVKSSAAGYERRCSGSAAGRQRGSGIDRNQCGRTVVIVVIRPNGSPAAVECDDSRCGSWNQITDIRANPTETENVGSRSRLGNCGLQFQRSASACVAIEFRDESARARGKHKINRNGTSERGCCHKSRLTTPIGRYRVTASSYGIICDRSAKT